MVAEPIAIEELQRLFNNIAFYYESLLGEIAASIEEIFSNVANNIQNIFGTMVDEIIGMFDNVAAVLENIFTELIGRIEEIVRGILDFTKGILKEITGFIQTLVQDTTQLFVDIFDKVFEGITSIVDEVSLLFSDIFDIVVTNIEKVVKRVEEHLTSLFGVIELGVDRILENVGALVQAIQFGVEEFISTVVNGVGGALTALLGTISNLPGEIASLTDQLVASARDNIGNPITSLPLKLISTLAESIMGEPLADADNMQLNMLNMVFGQSPVPRSPETMRELVAKFMPENPIVKFFVTLFLSIIIVPMVLGGIASANSQIILQEHALENPYRLIEPPDVVRASYMKLMEKPLVLEELQKHGFTKSAAETMLLVGQTLPPEAEQISWLLRGLISEEDFDTRMTAKGWVIENINLLKQAIFFIPPVQDLITMAVREAFTPEIAERFGQYEDLPPAFVENAAKQGVSKEWATNYWAAHWSLPSVQMGFQMLHRRVITEEDLNMLLRSADVMPFWRDKLIAISFSPLTRVDIRRMHKLGVLTDTQVFDAYQDIGYNKDNAQLLLDFTIALNSPPVAEDDADLSTLTRTNIINFYKDGVLRRVAATSLLTGIGMSIDAADLFLDGADMEIQRKERKDQIEIVLDRADAGVLTFEEAQDGLNRLGLQTVEIQIALAELAKREAQRNKIPNRGDLDKMLGANIIDPVMYIDTMKRNGYSQVWADRYLRLAQG